MQPKKLELLFIFLYNRYVVEKRKLLTDGLQHDIRR